MMNLIEIRKIRIFSLGLLFVFGIFFLVSPALAGDPKPTISHPSMSAKYVSQSIPDPIEIEAGAQKTVILKFKNVGTETWPVTGKGYISAYTMEPRYRNSDFASPNWTSVEQTAPIAKITASGATADLAIVLKAPDKVGQYTEEFYLASENYSWVAGGYFFLKIRVVPRATPSTPPESLPLVGGGEGVAEASSELKANKFIQNIESIEAEGGEQIKMILGFQNNGDKPWKNYSIVANQPTVLASVSNRLSFADELWYDASTIVKKDQEVAPGGIVRETVYFRAPTDEGEYTAKFYLAVNGQTLTNTYAEVDVTVTSNAPYNYQEPFGGSDASVPVSYKLDSEPRIRVGLWQPPSYVQFRSPDNAYDVYSGTLKKGTLAQNQLAILMRKDGQYYFRGGGLEFYSDEYIRLSPVGNPSAVFTLLNYSRMVTWKGPNNFNYYRGALEYRLGEVKIDALWVVNDLLLEDYVKGIGENGNISPPEYLKSQTVAQRSYAYATIQADKYGIFDVVATTGDQLYLGVESERIMPNFVAAVEGTRGYMATYDNKVVITPYYAHAVCRTKSWTEVWGGSTKPWLVPVETNYDCKYYGSYFGHGVGMSQMDASRRTTAEGTSWADLVKYYYTGVKVERIFE
ncbi:MAG: NBR1-Ig-like domain-containing protein [bacterium]|nr:NBR1-Ig-like domain-containing protein [bacterium]